MSLKRAGFAPLEGAEFQNALNAILCAGLEPSDFDLEERRTEGYGRGGTAVHKLVSIKRRSTGIQRQYSTGRGGGWPFEFERDLGSGFYGHPWPTHPGAPSAARPTP